eukprot:TRINITY_DN11990_c0_g1_i2.p1 TRINITY_DN11990_c0_g1~~TRINITY_DN11990_c0_g1_i2.p1  ORF type:complete len:241 (+),score=6.56 TRINITY_DN11990_c0_g1_i2:62-784(+)
MQTAATTENEQRVGIGLRLPKWKRMARVIKNRSLRSKLALEEDCDKVLTELNLDANTQLTRAEVKMILDILGLELNNYQRGELNILIEKMHCFNGNVLKRWIVKNRRFVLCKHLGRSLEAISNITIRRLPSIQFKASALKNSVTLPQIKLAKTPLRAGNKERLKNLLVDKSFERVFPTSGNGSDYCQKVRQKLATYLNDQEAYFAKSKQLINFIHDQCRQMKHFQNLILNETQERANKFA